MEGALCKELKSMGYKIVQTFRGRVLFNAPLQDVFKLNLWLRTAERVVLVLKRFEAETFDELFDGISQIPWGDYINKKGAFPIVKVRSNKSNLFSLSDIQAISKKAIVSSLSKKYGTIIFEEKYPIYPIHIYIKKNVVTVGIDTTGKEGLHKRGYRKYVSTAPLRETIAAGIIISSNWDFNKSLIDPFCGSGTIPIEASMLAMNIAPGIGRRFACNNWPFFNKYQWNFELEKAKESIKNIDLSIIGSDISPEMIKIAKLNAKSLNLHGKIIFEIKDFFEYIQIPTESWIVTNLPYGQRLKIRKNKIIRHFKEIFENNKDISLHFLSDSEKVPKIFGRKPKRIIIIYNSGLKVYLYQFW